MAKASKPSEHLKTGKSGPAELHKDNLPKDAKKHIKQSFMNDKSTHKKQNVSFK